MGEVKSDGVIMMKVILDNVEPSPRLGSKSLEEDLNKCNLTKFKGDLCQMLDSMEDLRQKIHARTDLDPPRYERILFRAIFSGSNH